MTFRFFLHIEERMQRYSKTSIFLSKVSFRRGLISRSILLYGFCLCSFSCTKIPEMKGDARVTQLSLLGVDIDVEKAGDIFTKGNFPQEKWWDDFQDLQLNALIEEGLKGSPTLSKAKTRVWYAKEVASARKSILFPNLNLDADVNWQYYGKNTFFHSLDANFPTTLYQVDLLPKLNYEFDFWGKNRHLFASAMGLKKAEEAEVASATLVITTAIAQGYFNVQRNLSKRRYLSEWEEIRKYVLEVIQKRKKHGLDTEMALLDSKKNSDEVFQMSAKNEELVETDLHSVCYLVGKNPGEIYLEPVSLNESTPLAWPANISLNLIARRPDLQAQIWKVEATAHEVGAAKADFYPNIDLSAVAGLETLHIDTLLSGNSFLGSLMPAIHLPLFTAGRLTANLKGKEAKFQEAIYTYNELILKAAQEVAEGVSALKWLSSQLDFENNKIKTLEAKLFLVEERAKNGLSNILDILYAKEALVREQLIYIDLKYFQNVAKINLIKALGGGYVSK